MDRPTARPARRSRLAHKPADAFRSGTGPGRTGTHPRAWVSDARPGDSSWADLATSSGRQYHARWPLPDVGRRWPRDDAMDYRYLHATGALNEAGAEPAGLALRRGRAASWRGHPVPPEVLDLLPESLAREHRVVPVGGAGETLIVAAVN